MNDPRIWFGRKHIGYGWGPRTWEGWAVIGLFIATAILLKHMGVIGGH